MQRNLFRNSSDWLVVGYFFSLLYLSCEFKFLCVDFHILLMCTYWPIQPNQNMCNVNVCHWTIWVCVVRVVSAMANILRCIASPVNDFFFHDSWKVLLNQILTSRNFHTSCCSKTFFYCNAFCVFSSLPSVGPSQWQDPQGLLLEGSGPGIKVFCYSFSLCGFME